MEGQLILDRFEIQERLGSGGFGVVYRGWDRRLERPVAIKVIEGGTSARPRVLREAQAAARLNHPGIVALYELGDDGSHAFLVSEMVEGETLDALWEQGGLSDRDVAAIGSELCAALGHAHERGVVHRDLKPQNVLVCSDPPQAKLMDFGVARVLDSGQLTVTGDVLGTVAYMAPEQADGQRVGPPADVYALALTLYQCWSGRNPVVGRSPAQTMRNLGERIRPLGEERPDLPADLCRAIDACLAPDPEDRAAVADLAEALRAALPLLDDEGGLRPVPVAERVTRLFSPGRAPALRATLQAGLVAMTAAAGLLLAGGSPPGYAYLLPLAAGLAHPRLPRLTWVLASSGLVLWAALGANRPGAALILAALTLAAPLLAPGAARLWPLAALAPALALGGLAPLFVALAGLAGSARRRIGMALLGYLWLAVAEAVSGTALLFGADGAAPSGWPESTARALQALEPALTTLPVILGVLPWAFGALALPLLVRGRAVVLDLLGAIVWGAGLVAGHRLVAGIDGLAGREPSPAGLLVACLLAAALAALWRSSPHGPADIEPANP